MKRLLLASAALALSGCAWDYSSKSPQIPVAPTISGQPAPQVANAVAPAPAAAAPVAAAAPAAQPAAATEPSSRTDYGAAANWLCKPGMANNPCEVNIDATVVKADGSSSVEKYAANPNAPIDCFYVYPTISFDPGPLRHKAGPEEYGVVQSQFARFGASAGPMRRSIDSSPWRRFGASGGQTAGRPATARPPTTTWSTRGNTT